MKKRLCLVMLCLLFVAVIVFTLAHWKGFRSPLHTHQDARQLTDWPSSPRDMIIHVDGGVIRQISIAFWEKDRVISLVAALAGKKVQISEPMPEMYSVTQENIHPDELFNAVVIDAPLCKVELVGDVWVVTPDRQSEAAAEARIRARIDGKAGDREGTRLNSGD